MHQDWFLKLEGSNGIVVSHVIAFAMAALEFVEEPSKIITVDVKVELSLIFIKFDPNLLLTLLHPPEQ